MLLILCPDIFTWYCHDRGLWLCRLFPIRSGHCIMHITSSWLIPPLGVYFHSAHADCHAV